jgi:hypothetical protein
MLTQLFTKNSHNFSSATKYAIIIGGFVLGFAFFFRAQLLSKFDLLFGDRGDTRFVLFVHEHVFQALLGHSDFLSPPYFYDVTRTLGFSDALLLNQIIYAPIRGLGADPYLALLLTIMTLSIAGYGFLYGLLRRFGRVPVIIGVFASFTFTFANNLFVNANHLQLFAIYYIPAVAYLSILAITEIHKQKTISLIAAGIAGLLYGLLLATEFYIAWFFGISIIIFSLTFIGVSWRAARAWFVADPIRVGMLGFVFVDGFVFGLIPFTSIYAPVYLGGSRNFNEYLETAPTFTDIANVGLNFVWGDLFEKIGFLSHEQILSAERRFAITPALQLLLLLSLLAALRPQQWALRDRNGLKRASIIAGATVYFALFLFTIKISEHSIFLIFFKLVPGGGAIRAGYRAMLVANFFVVISVAIAITSMSSLLLRQSAAVQKVKLARASIVALMVLAVVEQLNLTQRSLVSRTFERAHLANISAAPPQCRCFYIADEPTQRAHELQLDAMLIAQKIGVPTINGYSGVFPTKWGLYDTTAANYEHNAWLWAVSHGIDVGLCRLDLAHGTFTGIH